ncbi:acyltransferase family protein [Arenimonas sp.]|uniref:acyltransferase family protein n=1 Tax=Arenimonas sp. TaxID=1872635 RepID=UPI0039E5F1EA
MQTAPLSSLERLHGLDALRGIALILGVVVHASMAFLPGAQYFWVAHDTQPEAVLGLAFYVPHMFRMLLFFLLAGFFGRMALHRLGLRGFIVDRARRIGLPLAGGWWMSLTAIVLVLAWGAMLANGGSLPKETPPGPTFMPDDFPLTHLWFLYVLLLCYGGALLVRGAVILVDRSQKLRAMIDRIVRMVMTPFAPVLLAVPLAASLFFQAKWYAWFGIPTPDQSLYPNLPALVGFGSAFTIGWLLHRQQDLLRALEGRWLFNLALAIACTASCLSLSGLSPLLLPAKQDAQYLAYTMSYTIGGWSWSLGLIGLCLRFLSGFSPARRYLADASYWIYLAHLPLVMALQVAMTQVEWSAFVEFPLVLAASMALLLASYHWLVRGRWLGNLLNGRKPAKATAHTALAANAS